MKDSFSKKEIWPVKEFYNEISSQYYGPDVHAVSCRVREINEGILKTLRADIAGPILDIGCGGQRPVEDSFGCDLSLESLKRRKKLFPSGCCVCADIRALPFAEEYFSAIFAGLMFDHIDDSGRAFSSLRHSAAEGARLVLTIYDRERLPALAYRDNLLEYGTIEGKIYRVPSYQRDFRELQKTAALSGWTPAAEVVSYDTTSSDYRLLRLDFLRTG